MQYQGKYLVCIYSIEIEILNIMTYKFNPDNTIKNAQKVFENPQ